MNDNQRDKLLTPAEVARLMRVDPKTVARWALAGKLPAIRTLGGHRRYRADVVEALLAPEQATFVPCRLPLPCAAHGARAPHFAPVTDATP